MFTDRADFERWLHRHGQTWERFASQHRTAASALSKRGYLARQR